MLRRPLLLLTPPLRLRRRRLVAAATVVSLCRLLCSLVADEPNPGAQTRPEQCCNTCEEVREAYRIRGWAFANPEGIVQCNQEGFSQQLSDAAGEGCQVRGRSVFVFCFDLFVVRSMGICW